MNRGNSLLQDPDRLIAVVGGAALTWTGLRRWSAFGLGMAAVGAILMVRGAGGCWPMFGSSAQCNVFGRGVRRILKKYGAGVNAGTSELPRTAPARDKVHAASEDSFPASDPPGWTGNRSSITQVAE